jgi:hypothetical protein
MRPGKGGRGHQLLADRLVYPRMIYVRGLVTSFLREIFVSCREGGQN